MNDKKKLLDDGRFWAVVVIVLVIFGIYSKFFR